MDAPTPYCGQGPVPAEIASRWNLDPWLLAVLLAAAGAYALHRRRGGEGRDGLAGASLAVLAIAFVSPLCALSSALFAARVAHHAALVAIAAPLLAFALPRLPVKRRVPLAAATLLQTVALWFWHAPGAYAWALSSDGAYWLMQLTLLASALLFWMAIRAAPAIASAGALLVTMMQMGLLGALITFAAQPLYAPHLTTTAPWGLSPLEDQQLGGLIMWAPMAALNLAAGVALAGRFLARADLAGARP